VHKRDLPKGVYPNHLGTRFRAIFFNKKERYYLGSYLTIEEAHIVYLRKVTEIQNEEAYYVQTKPKAYQLKLSGTPWQGL
jgi:hypothetical protein